MNGLAQTLRTLGMGRLIILGGVGVALAIFFVFMANRMAAPSMGLLYGSLEQSDASEIVGRLEAMGVPYQLRGDGSQILVPSDRVLRVRMALAGDGLPAGGSVGYEIFDRSEGLGTTNLVQNINVIRALEGELARTISSLGPVAGARVHLVVPRRELFNPQQTEASASIAVKLRGTNALARAQVAAIQNLVAAAVPSLSPDRIAIVDDNGNLLARGNGEEDGTAAGAAGAEDFRAAFEAQMRRSIESLLAQSVGAGKVRAQVSAELDFDRFTTNDEIYDPDGQVVRSQQLVEEQTESLDSEGNVPVSVGNTLPDADPEQQAASNSNTTARTEETINYEISRTVRTHVREAGSVKRLSVAVLVDGRYVEGADGERVYEARSEEELAQFSQLVKTAVGFDEARGDTIEVVNLPFADIEVPGEIEESAFSIGNVDVMQVIEIIVLGFVAVLVVLLVLRPLVNRLVNAPPASAAGAMPELAVEGPAAAPAALAAPAAEPAAPSAPKPPMGQQPEPEPEEEDDTLIDLAKVEGRVRQSHVRKIGEIVDKHPEEALNIVRNWLYTE